jgi:hypothetical protein
MSELNKDGLIPGQEVDFETLNRINKSRINKPVIEEAVKNEHTNNKHELRKRGKHSLSGVAKAAKKKEADKE